MRGQIYRRTHKDKETGAGAEYKERGVQFTQERRKKKFTHQRYAKTPEHENTSVVRELELWKTWGGLKGERVGKAEPYRGRPWQPHREGGGNQKGPSRIRSGGVGNGPGSGEDGKTASPQPGTTCKGFWSVAFLKIKKTVWKK